jgi:hypothetical protein
MIRSNQGLTGPAHVAERLQKWHQSDCPDLIDATIQYVTEEWSEDREASVAAVYSVYVRFWNLGESGNIEAGKLASELASLLEQRRRVEDNHNGAAGKR